MKRRVIVVTTDFGNLEGYRTRPSLTNPKLGEAKLRNVGCGMREIPNGPEQPTLDSRKRQGNEQQRDAEQHEAQ